MQKHLCGRKPSFIYQRYSINNYSGLKLARFYGVPFVLEYNGSQIWINRHWYKYLKYEKLCERIELLNLKAADVVVVVSQAMEDELVARGINSEKILVNPNESTQTFIRQASMDLVSAVNTISMEQQLSDLSVLSDNGMGQKYWLKLLVVSSINIQGIEVE